MSNWPYPRIVAHRGGGKLAPENTLAAIDVGAKYGHKIFLMVKQDNEYE